MIYQEDKQPQKISERKIYAYTRMSEKWGIQKNRAIHILFVERGATIYLAALKKGAIRHAHQYYAIYRKFPPATPPPPPHTHRGSGRLHAVWRNYACLDETVLACAVSPSMRMQFAYASPPSMCSSPMQVRQACAIRLCKSAIIYR